MAISDGFTGTNGVNLTTYSANWAMCVGLASLWLISGNKIALQGGSSADTFARYAGSFPADQFAQAAMTPISTANSYIGVAVRAASNNGYLYYRQAGAAAGDGCQLFKCVAGVFTQLGSDGATQAITTGDTIRLTAASTTLTPNENGSTTSTPGAQTDSSLSSGAPGIAGYSATLALHPLLDDFSATDASVGSANVLRQPDQIGGNLNGGMRG